MALVEEKNRKDFPLERSEFEAQELSSSFRATQLSAPPHASGHMISSRGDYFVARCGTLASVC
jgi:hypothetical protein